MDKKAQSQIVITIIIIIGVILLAYFILNKPAPVTEEEVVKCIGKNSILYTQLGCSHCEDQEEMFGENKKHLNIVDCFYVDDSKCQEIPGTPTWIIKGKTHSGVQTIEELKELTGC